MGCKAGQCNNTSTPQGIFILIPSLEGWATKAEEAPSPHEARRTPLDTNPVFQRLGENITNKMLNSASLVAEHDFSLVIYYISNKCFGSA